ncbi:MAG: hypothetical protein BWY85_02237 [Firmicutes bacterium ADurb.Bin506]|nr:MAG: hypothetical protein BWY85_02237 [Firmicutes bacterium ADurb.Bin506]
MSDPEGIVTLVDEDGHEQDFAIDEIVEIDEVRYAVLIPVECYENEDEEVCEDAVIMRVEVDDDGEEYLADIEDEEEFERVVEVLESFDDDEAGEGDDDDDDDDEDEESDEY